MMKSETVIFLSILTIFFPLASITWLWRARADHRTTRLLGMLIFAAIVEFSYLAGIWGFYSYYLRYFMLVLFAAAATRAYSRPIGHPPVKARTAATATRLAVLALLVILDALVISGHFYSGKPVELAFPLKSGTYYVMQGGNSKVTNPFHGLYKTINAVDIVKLNRWGNRAESLFPYNLSSYAVFGETIYSPCDGEILEVIDGLSDLVPHTVDVEHSAGNHIVIQCKGVNVLLAHMMNGSVSVRDGDVVQEGQPVGRVGNSGNTFEPHLHIHAVRSVDGSLRGPSVPMLFSGRFLSLNSLVKITASER